MRRLLRFTLFFLLISLTLLLVACGSIENRPVTFAIFGDPAELAAYEGLVAAFETEHPEIDIELQHTAGQSDYRQRLATQFTAGAPPNVFLLNYRRLAPFAADGGLEPLTAYLADSEIIQETDFYPNSITTFKWQDELWCIPQNVSSLVVYYNEDLFTAAGVPLPTNTWTRDDFLAAALALTQDQDGDGVIDQYGVGLEASLFRLAPFVWQNGGDIVDDPAQPTHLTLDSPAAKAAFQWLVDLQLLHHVVPDRTAESAEESESRFLNGRLAMFFNSRRGVPTYRTITSFTWNIAPLPSATIPAGILHSDGYCMAAATENKEAAWTFIEYANSVAGQTLIAASGRTVPSLIEVAKSPAFLDGQPPTNSQVFLDTIPMLKAVPIMSTWIGIEETAGQEVERAFYGEATIDEAIAAAAQLTQPYFDEAHNP
ncbi:MAG: sugar ABC transporter substrate-binding protein [Chloroflexi bacterium]|nr:sugar ABC transporter substrate-binding protein [Chloroflexota bacterium]MBP8057882.1 sugar ABC transporter substrate-binding protein [Chloroflexota bacterium]